MTLSLKSATGRYYMNPIRAFSTCAPSHRLAHGVLAGSLAVVLGLSGVCLAPTLSYAATSDEISGQLEAAQQELDQLTHDLELAQAKVDETETQLSDTQDQITQLEEQIAETLQELDEAREVLSDHISSFYKSGGVLSLTDLVLSSGSFEELTSNLYYAGKVVDAENEQIQSVKQLQGELEGQQAELSEQETQLQGLLEQQQTDAASLSSAQAEAQSYVDGLSSELQEALAAERAAEAERQRQAAEAAAQEQQNNQGGGSANHGGSTNGGGPTNGGGSTNNGSGNAGGGSSQGGSGSLSSSQRSTIVSAAKSQLGVSYVLGACSPGVAMDCSGLTSYAYAQAGISIPHQSGAQYRMVSNAGNLKTSASALSVGDLVFYQSGGVIYHVAIYIGGGQVCHANGYGSGVVITSVFLDSGFCGGGSPV